ncbi:single-stranded DNA-binding protein 3-like isoform X2 [Ptychodera flava]|uniref:single-stranded DNA-binding protein 3-like isoform X2 n=1 Tax=Ptychodera flava TaxID=63121 RepID=UPI00396A6012
MYAKGKGSSVPSDSQAREKLALYVYEYLLHVGAQKSAQTFLSEIRWEKNITLGEPPGFLHSWWCVFWDLYCAAPERRETCEHSSEAKAFHDYSAAAPSPVLGQMPPNEMPGGPMPPGFFQQPQVSQPSPHPQPPHPNNPMMPQNQIPPHSQMMDNNQPFMSPRYPGGPRPMRMPQQQPPGGVPGSQPLLPNTMDPTRQPGHPNMGGPMQRMNPPRGMPMQPSYGGGMRPPHNNTMGPGMPMSMPGAGRPWQTNTSTMNYSQSSPGNYGPGGPPGGGGPPGTPIMPSPQGQGPQSNHRLPQGNHLHKDSSNSGGDSMYSMMKPVPGGNMPGDFPMGTGPDGPMSAMAAQNMQAMNGELDGIPKSSPNSVGPGPGPGTPREENTDMGGQFLPPFQDNDHNESAAILKIKESMQEEAKRFEKETPSDHPEYFMQ